MIYTDSRAVEILNSNTAFFYFLPSMFEMYLFYWRMKIQQSVYFLWPLHHNSVKIYYSIGHVNEPSAFLSD
jgi:hypothetical protein